MPAPTSPFRIRPVVACPRVAQVGKPYLLTVDVECPDFPAWPYPTEEHAIRCLVDAQPLFACRSAGDSAVVVHRFGGTYGPARFLLTAAAQPVEGTVRIVLLNSQGVVIRTIQIPDVRVVAEHVPAEVIDFPVPKSEPVARSSNQKFVARNRAPRVQLEYDVEIQGSLTKVELPFVIGVMADLSGHPIEPLPDVRDRKFLEIDFENFDARLEAMRPRVAFQVPNHLNDAGELAVDLTFARLEDFSPAHVARQVAPLASLLSARTQLGDLLTALEGKPDAVELLARFLQTPPPLEEPSSAAESASPAESAASAPAEGVESLTAEIERAASNPTASFDALMEMVLKPRTEAGREKLETAVRILAEHTFPREGTDSSDLPARIEAVVGELDRKLSAQVNPILHHPDFQSLEASWRGLHSLVSHSETDAMLKIRVLNLSKSDLAATLQPQPDAPWESTPLFRKIHEEEFGAPGGQPYGLMIGDYPFDHGPADVAILRDLGRIAAAANMVFLGGASPSLLNLSSWQELNHPPEIAPRFSTNEHAAWNSLRESEDATYLGLTLPRFLSRPPWDPKRNPVEEFHFQEEIEQGGDTRTPDPEKFVWSNSAYLMGRNIARAFKLYGWCARIHGLETGGMVEGLPMAANIDANGSARVVGPVETALSDRREFELSRQGLIPLCLVKNYDAAVFPQARSLRKSGEYHDPAATADAGAATQLAYTFAVSRILHYLRCLTRDRIGSYRNHAELEKLLNDWLAGYCASAPDPSDEARARRPLAMARVSVEDSPDSPGVTLCHVTLKPHFQVQGPVTPTKITIRIPSPQLPR